MHIQTGLPKAAPCAGLRTRHGIVSTAWKNGALTQLQQRLPGVARQRKAPRTHAVASPVLEPSALPRHELDAPYVPQAIPDMWARLAEQHGDRVAMSDPHHTPARSYTYREAAEAIRLFASGVQSLGLRRGECVSLFSENSSRWLIADQGLMVAGAIDAVRGVSSTVEELQYIMQHSSSSALVVQDAATLDKLLPALAPRQPVGEGEGGAGAATQYSPLSGSIRFVVVLWGEPSAEARAALACPACAFQDVLDAGAAALGAFQAPRVEAGDVATLCYTSGTTGHPKAVALTHSNLLYQVHNLSYFLGVRPGARTLSLLPPWHIYERTCGYYLYHSAASQTYSNIRKFREDLSTYPPDYFVCVPLVLDTLHAKVMATLKKASAVRRALATSLLAAAVAYVRARRVVDGVALQYARQPAPLLALVGAWLVATLLTPINWLAQRLVVRKVREALGIRECVVSGGGSLAAHLDDFYEAIGLPVLNGWGLSETSPVVACRRNQPKQNVRGSVGWPTPGTAVRVVDPETLRDVPDGQQGLILARGPGVMRGYYNDAAATAKAFKAGDGWFDTGDLGWRAPPGVAGSNMAGAVVLAGRAKDTIVLTSGENVEPQPIEDALCCSALIKFAVLVGSGHRALGALVVPDEEGMREAAAARGVEDLSESEVWQLIRGEIDVATAGRVRWEHIAAFEVLQDPFSVDDGTLTRTMKPRRAVIMEKYAGQVQALEKHLR